MPQQTLTLLELNSLVRQVIASELSREYWVEAELSECRENNGHCYMELIQKDERSNTPVARASAKCWRSAWSVIRPYFERITQQRIHAGMKLRMNVYAQFHEAYGFSWIVTDIDPTFTLGDMARRRQEIIRQLKEEGVFDLQRELSLPLFCQRIAIISAPTAAGYGDFCNQLANNPYGFKFQTQLFPAIMQGEQVEQSIIAALEKIYSEYSENTEYSEHTDHSERPFDCVVIIRGGGATADMSGFDTLALAENVANFPLPIITGIGHDRDECILDMVSHVRVKTPTAAAAFLIDHLKQVLDVVNDSQSRLTRYAQQKFSTLNIQLTTLQEILPKLFSAVKARQDTRIDHLSHRLITAAREGLTTHRTSIDILETRIPVLLERRLTTEKHRLQLTEEKAKSMDPALLLRRGYSITLKDGKAVKDATLLQKGDMIETRLDKGTIKSIIA